MKYYSDEQLKTLYTLNACDYVIIQDIPEHEDAIYRFLVQEKLAYTYFDNTPNGRMLCARITEAGASYLTELSIDELRSIRDERTARIRWRITTAIAIYGAIISTIALFGTYLP